MTRPPGRSRRRAAALAVAACLAVAAGCASSPSTSAGAPSSTATTSTTPPATGPIAGPIAPTTIAPPNVGGPSSTVIPMEDQLLSAMHGRWTGDAGSFDVGDDGVGRLDIRACPLRPGGDRFGYTTDCAPRSAQGRASVGRFQVSIAGQDRGELLQLGAYVDGSGRLHLGDGQVFETTPLRQVQIETPDGQRIAVDGDRCTSDADGTGAKPVVCEWSTKDNLQVLTIGDQVWVYDKFAGVIASPQVAFSVFSR